MGRILRIAEEDNVAVAVEPIAAGAVVNEIRIECALQAGHKVALRPIRAGEPIVKYGFPIGVASRDIVAGDHVHVHNVDSILRQDFVPDERHSAGHSEPPGLGVNSKEASLTFQGFRRANGRIGIRNEIWILPTVGCVGRLCERIALAAREALAKGHDTIDGVYALTHPYGCSQLGDDLAATRRIVAALAAHPNTAGVLVIGLGCESNQLATLCAQLGPTCAERVEAFVAQEVEDELSEGLRRVAELARRADSDVRESLPLGELVLGMKCGGSDGLSGLTANPLVGRIADTLAAAGGTVLLSEVPEMFGAEPVLLGRAHNAQVADETVRMVNGFRDYFRSRGEPIDENPSPGNKAGGITTLAEKSLGCVQKGGHAPIMRVLQYGEVAPSRLGGVALVRAPGNDGVSSTAMVAAGAHLLLFTTGRGTPMGFPVPTVKISSNSDLARRKPYWIDFDAGPIAQGAASVESLGSALLAMVVDVASGRARTQNEIHGERDIAIWKDGVTL